MEKTINKHLVYEACEYNVRVLHDFSTHLPEQILSKFNLIQKDYIRNNRKKSFFKGLPLIFFIYLIFEVLLYLIKQDDYFLDIKRSGYMLAVIMLKIYFTTLFIGKYNIDVNLYSWNHLLLENEMYSSFKQKLNDMQFQESTIDFLSIYLYLKNQYNLKETFLSFFEYENYKLIQDLSLFYELLSLDELGHYNLEKKKLPKSFKLFFNSFNFAFVLFIPILIVIMNGAFQKTRGNSDPFPQYEWLINILIIVGISYISFYFNMNNSFKEIELLIFQEIYQAKGIFLDAENLEIFTLELSNHLNETFDTLTFDSSDNA